MSRFEAEISSTPTTFATPFAMPSFGNIPPPPMPPMLIPHQVNRGSVPGSTQMRHHRNLPFNNYAPTVAAPAVVSAKPTLYNQGGGQVPTHAQAAAHAQQQAAQAQQQQQAAVVVPVQQSTVDFMSLQSEVQKKLKKLKGEKVSAELAISQGKASSALQSFSSDDHKRRGKNKKLMRTAGGQTWEDMSLADWSDDDFRIFCGDLGNDVTDELLTRTFNKFPSFQRAKVIRDKRTNKSKGYGFISFKDPADFTKAMKEMNGRYVGSRPIKLRKSCWKNRSIDVVRKKDKEKAALLSMLTAGYSNNR